MTGVAIRIDVNATGAKAAFAALRHANADLRPVLEDIGAELESSTLDRFDTNVGPDGVPWTPSARAIADGSRTLVLSSTLRDSTSYRLDGATAVEVSEGGAAGSYASAHQTGMDEDVAVKAYARAFSQVFGRRIAGVAQVQAHTRHMRLPARPSLGLSAADQVAIPEIAVDHWRRALLRGIG